MNESNVLIDDLTSIILNHMFKSQSLKMNTNSIQIYFNKNNASLLSSRLYLEDNTQINLDSSSYCGLMGLDSSFCSNLFISQRVKFNIFSIKI